MSSRTPSPVFESLESLIAHLSADPEREPIAAELGVLQSIYGDDAVRLWRRAPSSDGTRSDQGSTSANAGERGTIRYEVTVSISPLSEPDTAHPTTLLISLPSTYPASSPPQLQLLSRYIGPFGVDAGLFGAVLRTFISQNGVEWTEGCVCVFDGIEWVRERCAEWLGDKMSAVKVGELAREDERPVVETKREAQAEQASAPEPDPEPLDLPEGVAFTVAEPIVDRKSVFIGRACRITDPAQVPLILAHLMSDRRIARAAHPIINAWRCRVGSNLHQDNDDDGETAAGGRLAHLLQILEVENVLVVVTRYFGGIHLGPDRFKHINQAARNALELGGFLDVPSTDGHSGGRKKGKMQASAGSRK
ncbi:UPF0029-domain-containing protein [Wolfiporia cocos MD-104 SS10]|uniref:UPF0029-domain-containing protein n=1 Tax=Wolfiporia cocos (strain MD-104) TaxID=742152 RepID=A0A2H3JQ41_WOLCO|nr:UPF0029-domain-containing protein [Wolfiporia cocos MD-104 SS10]